MHGAVSLATSHRFSPCTTVERSTAELTAAAERLRMEQETQLLTLRVQSDALRLQQMKAQLQKLLCRVHRVPRGPHGYEPPTGPVKGKVCDVPFPVPDCRVLYNSQSPRRLCIRTRTSGENALPLTRVVLAGGCCRNIRLHSLLQPQGV